MDNLREKLVELIIDAKRTNPETGSFTEYLADHLIANGVTLAGDITVPTEWISVKDRLPQEGEDVLVFGYWHEKFQPLICYLSPHRKGEWFTTVAGQQVYAVTHWMPMPEPPKGE